MSVTCCSDVHTHELLRNPPMQFRFRAMAAAALVIASAADAQVTSVRLAGGLQTPLYAVSPPGDTSRLFIAEKGTGDSGFIEILNLGTSTINASPFLTLPNVTSLGEAGLLGVAFHDDYASNGRFYVHYTRASPEGRVIAGYRRSAVNPDFADPLSEEIVLFVPGTVGYHNGGWIDFGPDGFLYIAFGDGTNGNNAQSITANLLGKILRIDVDGADNIPGNADDDAFPADPDRNYSIPPGNPFAGPTSGLDEIWCYGLRNPWRPSIDRATGDLWIADVGWQTREEVSFLGAGMSGNNFGWPCLEGTLCLVACCTNPGFTAPVHEYDHGFGCAITGGFVYRGCAMPELRGRYFFSDSCSGRVWSFVRNGTSILDLREHTEELWGHLPFNAAALSFGEDALGELYICDFDSGAGAIHKFVPIVPAPDCNNNLRPDGCDIAQGFSPDVNGNGVPDECDGVCGSADFDGDGDTGTDADIEAFFACLGGNCCPACQSADFDGDGDTGTDADIEAFFRVLGGGTC